MKWKDIKLSGKFGLAFGLIILLLIIVAIWAVTGISGIVKNADEVIEGNKLRTEINQKYIDHLIWANQLNQLLTNDEITELSVETNHHRCKFGQWYYGNGRERAEQLVPELKPIFDKLEEPHAELHKSAIDIDRNFIQANRHLSNYLREMKSAHLTWAHSVKDICVEAKQVDEIDVEKDPHKCELGKWLHSAEVSKIKSESPEFASFCTEIETPHNQLHKSVYQVEEYFRNNQIQQGKDYYMNNTKPLTYDVLNIIDKMLAWNDSRLNGMDKANVIYNNTTVIKLNTMGALLKQVVDVSEKEIMTDKGMLAEARQTRIMVIIFSGLATLLAIILAIIIARGIIVPIKKGVKFASEVSNGDLGATIDINQKDEIGILSDSLKKMVEKLDTIVTNIINGADSIADASKGISTASQELSQGANEQASSVEEISSSMEEMTSNITQNTENSKQTEDLANQAAGQITTGNQKVRTTVESMKSIADKISIINEIAFQTNILALNAAVEAARAGKAGKGFAVVASEVRKLAEHSQKAANEIDAVSGSSVKIAEESGKMLEQIVPSIKNTARLIQEITAASMEQSSGADQVNLAIQQLNQVVQQNAASAQEMATSSEELSSQADELKNMVAFFKTRQEN